VQTSTEENEAVRATGYPHTHTHSHRHTKSTQVSVVSVQSINQHQPTLWGKKLHHFIFAITSCQIFLYCNNEYTNALINLEQNDIKIINLLWSVSSYSLVKCSKRTHVMTNVGFVT